MYPSHNFPNQCSYLPLAFKSEPFPDHVFQNHAVDPQQSHNQGELTINSSPKSPSPEMHYQAMVYPNFPPENLQCDPAALNGLQSFPQQHTIPQNDFPH